MEQMEGETWKGQVKVMLQIVFNVMIGCIYPVVLKESLVISERIN